MWHNFWSKRRCADGVETAVGHYCQAQPKLQVKLSLKAELALFLFPPAPAYPPARSSGIVVKPKMEDDLNIFENGRQPQYF